MRQATTRSVAGRGRRGAARGDPRARRRGRDRGSGSLTGNLTDLQTGLYGESRRALDWWPDGSALLANLVEGRHRASTATTSERQAILHADGTSGRTDLRRTRPSRLLARCGSASELAPTRLVSNHRGDEVLRAEGERVVAAAAPSRSGSTTSLPSHGFLRDAGRAIDRPRSSSGRNGVRPGWKKTDEPEVCGLRRRRIRRGDDQTRGSTGAREWRDGVDRRHRRPELEDLNAGLEWLQHGASPTRRALSSAAGRGADTTLMVLGKHPDLWLCGVAGIPVGDYEMS